VTHLEKYLLPVTPVDPKPDKKLLKKAIKEGEIICGVELVENSNIQIK